jgi:probable F420-dependent oxidoreductase
MDVGVVAALTHDGIGITDLAVAVEQAGLESLFLFEHTHLPVARRDLLDDPFQWQVPHLLDQFTALGAAAAVTSRIRLGTAVCLPSIHDPISLSKQVATIDHLSHGRFVFGVAAGWLTEEMRNHGVEPRLRWELMRERILAMKTIWTQDEAEFHGQHVDFDPIWLWPKPVQQPFPPVLVGGDGLRSLAAAAEYGDGWMPEVTDTGSFKAKLGELRELFEKQGRPEPQVTGVLFEADEELLASCAELGVTRCIVLAPSRDLALLRSFLDNCSQLAAAVAG